MLEIEMGASAGVMVVKYYVLAIEPFHCHSMIA